MTIETDRLYTPTGTVAAGHALRGLLGGRVYLPGDEAYDAVRLPWNVAVDQRPAAIALPRSASEVATVSDWNDS